MKKLVKGTTYAISIALTFWFVSSTAEVVIHNGQINYAYSKANYWSVITTTETEMRVIDCTPYGTDYEVTVEDIRGDQWAYYDSEQREIGTIMDIKMQDDRIVDAKVVK